MRQKFTSRVLFENLEKLEHSLKSYHKFVEPGDFLLKKYHFLNRFDPTLEFLHVSACQLCQQQLLNKSDSAHFLPQVLVGNLRQNRGFNDINTVYRWLF